MPLPASSVLCLAITGLLKGDRARISLRDDRKVISCVKKLSWSQVAGDSLILSERSFECCHVSLPPFALPSS